MATKKLFLGAAVGALAIAFVPQTDAFFGIIAAALTPFGLGFGGYGGGCGGGCGGGFGYGGFGGGFGGGCGGGFGGGGCGGCGGCGGGFGGQAVIFNRIDGSVLATITDDNIGLLDAAGALPPITVVTMDEAEVPCEHDDAEFDEEYTQFLIRLLEIKAGIVLDEDNDHFADKTGYVYSEEELIAILSDLLSHHEEVPDFVEGEDATGY